MAHIVTAGDLLDGHPVLDIECLDRVYLNAYVPILQSSGQVVAFMTQHLGMPIPSPALMEKIGTKFRRAVDSFASANGIPWVKFGKDDRKIDVMTPYLDRQACPRAAPGGPGSRFCRACTAATTTPYRCSPRPARPTRSAPRALAGIGRPPGGSGDASR